MLYSQLTPLYLLLTAHCSLRSAHRSLLTALADLLTTHCVYCLLLTAYCLLLARYYSLLTTCRLPPATCQLCALVYYTLPGESTQLLTASPYGPSFRVAASTIVGGGDCAFAQLEPLHACALHDKVIAPYYSLLAYYKTR